MKRLLVVLVILVPAAIWLSRSSVRAAAGPTVANVAVGFEISPVGSAAVLMPAGLPLVMHPDYYAFKEAARDELVTNVPTDIRNAWPFHQINVNEDGHKPEDEVRIELTNLLTALNARRAELAAANNLPDPDDIALSSGTPLGIKYTVWNETVTCEHVYALDMGLAPWTFEDLSIPATAEFTITLSWDTRLP